MIEVETNGVCASKILFDVEDNKIKSVEFQGGCAGNTQGLSSLLVGFEVEEVIKRLEGIDCKMRGTSCPDQLAKALKEMIESEK